MKPCERYLNAINELVDGTLGPIRRAELELHLEGCDGCRALASDLKKIADAAASLEPMAPPPRVWATVAERLRADGRIAPESRAGMFGQRNVAMLALAASLVFAVGAALYLLRPGAPSDPAPSAPIATATPPAAAPAASPAAPTVDPAAGGNARVEDAVKSVDTELALTQHHFTNLVELSKQSNPNVAAAVQKELLVMNTAIEKTRQALATDPQSEPARTSLYELLKQKIQFLQDTIALMNEMRQGDAAGAAQIVESGKT